MTPTARLQVLGAARIGVGATWLAGLAAGRRAAGAGLPPAGRVAAAALAVRDLAQGALLVVRPEPASALAGGVVDVLHGGSMVPVAVLLPRYRAAAGTSAAVALGWATVAALAARERRRVPLTG